MSKRKPALLIQDIIESGKKILTYTTGLDYDGFVANDLVVDTSSMLDAMNGQEFQFADSDGVHHTSYFQQAKTAEKIREWLGIAE